MLPILGFLFLIALIAKYNSCHLKDINLLELITNENVFLRFKNNFGCQLKEF
jgi:hypothetical protein